MQKTIKIKQIDAFTDKPFTGNPAGVVTEAQSLTDIQMLAIANEMNLSETAFVLPSDKADFRIRWFTTEKEVLFCGHATLATLYALAEESRFGMIEDAEYSFTVEALVGLLSVKVKKEQGKISAVIKAPEPKLSEENLNLPELASILGLREDQILSTLPIMRDTTVDYIFVPVKDLEALNGIRYDYNRLKDFGERVSVDGFSVFTTDTYDDDSQVHSRFFSPSCGITEDPVTGSANAPLAVYLLKNNLIKAELPVSIKAEQGDILRRKGRLEIRLYKDERGMIQAELIGEAVTVLLGEMFLD